MKDIPLLGRLIGFAPAVVLTALIGAYFGAGYAYFFASANIVEFSFDAYKASVITFLAIIVFSSFIWLSHFGIWHRLGFSGLGKSITTINKAADNPNLEKAETDDLTALLTYLNELPKLSGVTASVHCIIQLVGWYVSSALTKWDMYNNYVVSLGWLAAVAVFIGFTYLTADHMCRPFRAQIKEILLERGIKDSEQGLLGLRARFIYLIAITVIALAILAVNGQLGQMSVGEATAFIIMTTVVTSYIIYLFSSSIFGSLQQIQTAARDLAKGGRGILPISASEHEFVDFSHDFNSASREVFSIRRNLQELVDEKTKDLQVSLDEVKKLKEQQDGDYLLTSFLLEPLTQNGAESETSRIEFLLNQKKKFTFRRWNRDLGGDLCIAKSIRLRGKMYTVFINADAMGKSMQGAGGALVLGAAFSSLVERTLKLPALQAESPEKWLRDSFMDLHNLFETFDGRMLISIVMGLLDENGLVYYINAEHPWTAVLRDGKAMFIEDELAFRKLGTPGVDHDVAVRTFQMLPGDILISGSDGRDDIALDTDDQGRRILNEDEEVFLRVMEKSTGDLQMMLQEIESAGDITDDISFLKIHYQGNNNTGRLPLTVETTEALNAAKGEFKAGRTEAGITLLEEALAGIPQSLRIKTMLMKAYIKNRKYHKAIGIGDSILAISEADSEILYLYALAALRINDAELAMDMAKRAVLRNPHDTRLSLLMAKSYSKQKNDRKMKKWAQRVLDISPDNPTAHDLINQSKNN